MNEYPSLPKLSKEQEIVLYFNTHLILGDCTETKERVDLVAPEADNSAFFRIERRDTFYDQDSVYTVTEMYRKRRGLFGTKALSQHIYRTKYGHLYRPFPNQQVNPHSEFIAHSYEMIEAKELDTIRDYFIDQPWAPMNKTKPILSPKKFMWRTLQAIGQAYGPY